MELEQFATALQVKSVNTEQRLIEGYAAAFGNIDRTNDIIEPHAFDRTLGEHKDVLVFLGHNATGLPLGEPVHIHADERGLWTQTKIYPTSQGDDLLQVAKARMATGKSLGMSIGFRTKQQKMGKRTKDGPIRHLMDIDLVEYSFLASPDLAANPLAVTTSVKRAEGKATSRTLDSYEDLIADLQAAVNEARGGGMMGMGCCVCATYADHVIVSVPDDDGDQAYYDYPYTLDADGEPVLGKPTEVDQAYVTSTSKAKESNVDESKATWTTEYINNLPDSAFAYIESGGTKDEEGKTVPRALRHYPHHNADGSVDRAHLVNAVARAEQNPSTGDKALPHLERHEAAMGIGKGAKSHDDAHDEQWQDGAIAPALLLQQVKLGGLADDIAKEQIAMGQLSIDTKAGRRISTEKLSRLKEIIAHLQEVVDWGESVELGEDGKSQVDWYRTQADLLELQLSEVA